MTTHSDLKTFARIGVGLAFGGLLGCSDAGSAASPSGGAGGSGMSGTSAGATSSSGESSGGGGAATTGGTTTGGTTTGGTASGGSAGAGGMVATSTCFALATDEEQPMLLSQTGCVNMTDPTKPAPGLLPYSVRSALWSDGATKERFMRVPDGSKIHVLDCAVDVDACKEPGLGGNGEDEGHFDMPVGTVLVKNFSIEGKHIETRLLLHRSTSNLSGWRGFSYEWNDDQTDATLLPDNETGKDKPVGSAQQVWHYPSRSQCMDCHTRYGGRSLGPSVQQLNSDFAYEGGSMNQLAKLEQLGLFDSTPKSMAGLPDPQGSDGTLEQRARSYLQTNCSICHRPGGENNTIDMRFGTAFSETALCSPVEKATDRVPPYGIKPGKPTESTLSVRMHALDMLRMPKIGSLVVDPKGTQLIDDWITAMASDACGAQP